MSTSYFLRISESEVVQSFLRHSFNVASILLLSINTVFVVPLQLKLVKLASFNCTQRGSCELVWIRVRFFSLHGKDLQPHRCRLAVSWAMVWLDGICRASDGYYALREEDVCCSGWVSPKNYAFERLQFALCAFVNGRWGGGETEVEGITIPQSARQQDETGDKRL